jgi:hypothetical protein
MNSEAQSNGWHKGAEPAADISATDTNFYNRQRRQRTLLILSGKAVL